VGRWPDVGDRWLGEDGGWAWEERVSGQATTAAGGRSGRHERVRQ
jgi:hypothetical protein